MQDVIDLLDIAAKSYPLKALAPDIGKAESTLRNELTQQEGYKLGLITTYQILKYTKDYRALDRLNNLLGRVSFEIPKVAIQTDMPSLLQMMADLTIGFGEQMASMGKALSDGVINKEEAASALHDLMFLIKHAAVLKAYLEQLV
jgi:hypothetical protein